MTDAAPQDQRRRGGRRERRDLRTRPDHAMLPQLTGRLPLTEPMDGEQIERIDRASLDILEDVGVVFRDDIALEDWRRAGADIRGERVHLDRALVKSLISTIPSTITLHARNPEKSVTLGGRQSIFVPMTGAPYRGTDGPPDFAPASANHPFVDPAFGQDLYGHDDIRSKRRGCSGDGGNPVWRGVSGNTPCCGGQLQWQFAAGVG